MFAAAAAAKSQSVALETAWPYRTARPAGIDSRGVARVTSWHEITSRAQVLASIDTGKPVVMGTMITPSWQTTTTGSISAAGQEIGGHAFEMVGYATDSRVAGGGYFIIKNSWGEAWGDAGYGYVPFAQCQQHWCAFIGIDGVATNGL